MASDTMKTINDVPLILRREIEARMVEPFIRAFAKELGEEKTIEIVKSVVAGLAEEAGEGLAKTLGDNSLDSFVKKRGMLLSTKLSIIATVTVLMGFGFFMMARKGIWIPCIILAVVWLAHILYFTLRVKTIPKGETQ